MQCEILLSSSPLLFLRYLFSKAGGRSLDDNCWGQSRTPMISERKYACVQEIQNRGDGPKQQRQERRDEATILARLAGFIARLSEKYREWEMSLATSFTCVLFVNVYTVGGEVYIGIHGYMGLIRRYKSTSLRECNNAGSFWRCHNKYKALCTNGWVYISC